MSPSAAALAGTPSLKGFGGVAQLGEHLLCKQGVDGSNPFTSTNLRTAEVVLRSSKSEGGQLRSSPEASLFGSGLWAWSAFLDIVNSLCDRGEPLGSRLHGWDQAEGF